VVHMCQEVYIGSAMARCRTYARCNTHKCVYTAAGISGHLNVFVAGVCAAQVPDHNILARADPCLHASPIGMRDRQQGSWRRQRDNVTAFSCPHVAGKVRPRSLLPLTPAHVCSRCESRSASAHSMLRSQQQFQVPPPGICCAYIRPRMRDALGVQVSVANEEDN
jgi:hypothetical protein